MLLIGAGAGPPWGLMDGLAMSVAPPERAGMAAGIFSTTRVAGEGIALASVNALLAGLIRHRMEAIDGVSQVAASAQYLAAGDLAGALALNPHASALLPRPMTTRSAGCCALVVITLAGAAVAAGLLRERPDRRGAGMTATARATIKIRGCCKEVPRMRMPPPQPAPNRRAWKPEIVATLMLALPLVLSNLAQIAMTVTDVMFIGRLLAAAASALGANLYSAIAFFALGLVSATAPMAARAARGATPCATCG